MKGLVDMLRERLESMEIKDLIYLVLDYDQYIRKFNEELQGSARKPFCLSDFLDNKHLEDKGNQAEREKELRKEILLAISRSGEKK